MLILVSGATATLKRLNDDRFGVLIVPSAGNKPEALHLRPRAWAMDNEAFSRLDVEAFVRMLKAYHPYQASDRSHGCLFVVAPDVVGDARKTLDLWPFWSTLIRGLGFPAAFVIQDGQTVAEMPTDADAIFIGGTTNWKLGTEARTIAAYAKAHGLWLHMGRVNSRRRLRYAKQLGVDSIDGSGWSKWPDIRLGLAQQWLTEQHQQPELVL